MVVVGVGWLGRVLEVFVMPRPPRTSRRPGSKIGRLSVFHAPICFSLMSTTVTLRGEKAGVTQTLDLRTLHTHAHLP